jgi:hypothetical protein
LASGMSSPVWFLIGVELEGSCPPQAGQLVKAHQTWVGECLYTENSEAHAL